MRQLSRFLAHIIHLPDRLGPPSRSLVSVPRRGSRRGLLAGELLPRLISGRRGERTKEQDRFRCQRTEQKRSATDADDATSLPPSQSYWREKLTSSTLIFVWSSFSVTLFLHRRERAKGRVLGLASLVRGIPGGGFRLQRRNLPRLGRVEDGALVERPGDGHDARQEPEG